MFFLRQPTTAIGNSQERDCRRMTDDVLLHVSAKVMFQRLENGDRRTLPYNATTETSLLDYVLPHFGTLSDTLDSALQHAAGAGYSLFSQHAVT